MSLMSLTLDTSHLEMSPLNDESEWNIPHILSDTAETFQDPIGPHRPLEQSEDSTRHTEMAPWSSNLDFGAHPVVVDNGLYGSGGSEG